MRVAYVYVYIYAYYGFQRETEPDAILLFKPQIGASGTASPIVRIANPSAVASYELSEFDGGGKEMT